MNATLYILATPVVFLLLAIVIMLASCTYSISMVHTEGTATDVVDNDQKPSTEISPTITGIPAI